MIVVTALTAWNTSSSRGSQRRIDDDGEVEGLAYTRDLKSDTQMLPYKSVKQARNEWVPVFKQWPPSAVRSRKDPGQLLRATNLLLSILSIYYLSPVEYTQQKGSFQWLQSGSTYNNGLVILTVIWDAGELRYVRMGRRGYVARAAWVSMKKGTK